MILASLISYGQAIVMGALQGVTELFPISSLGHSVILPSLLGWNIHQNDPYFITFLVATHLATALVLLAFFWRDWVRIIKGMGRSLRDRQIAPDDTDAKLGWLLVIGTIPAGLLGLLLEHKLRHVFASPQSASIFLALNGLLLFGAEALRRRSVQVEADDDARIARQVGWLQAAGVGAVQALALIPGLSRSGATMGAASSSVSPTRTPPASPSCSRPRSSGPPPCSSFRSLPATRATACAARRSSAPCSLPPPPTSRFAS